MRAGNVLKVPRGRRQEPLGLVRDPDDVCILENRIWHSHHAAFGIASANEYDAAPVVRQGCNSSDNWLHSTRLELHLAFLFGRLAIP